MSLASITLIIRRRIKPMHVEVECDFWQNKMVYMVLPCVKFSMVVIRLIEINMQ